MGTRNFPTQLTTFVGRDRELVELRKLGETARLLTLTGPGGAGKTRLASALCEEIADRFNNDAWFVDLASVMDPDLIPSAVATALGVSSASQDITTSLIDSLAGEERLVLLDNCEHVLGAASTLVGALLPACTGLTIIATSREALGVGNETVWLVPAMAVPRSDDDLETLNTYDAVRLIVDRASMANRTFELTRVNASGIVRVIERLDGIPLALELAAAWTRMLTPEQIADKLDDRFRLLTRGKTDAPARHQTLRAAIDWSYELLSERDRMVFDRVSVFRGGLTLEAAEAICTDDNLNSLDVLEGLHDLVESSLVVADTTGETGRYTLLETIREYAAEMLGQQGGADGVRDRHLTWFLAFAHEGVQGIGGEDQTLWLDKFDLDHDNIREAMKWSLHGGSLIDGLELAAWMGGYWSCRGYFVEGRAWSTQMLEATETEATGMTTLATTPDLRGVRGRAFAVLSQMCAALEDLVAARPAMERSVEMLRGSSSQSALAAALSNLGGLLIAEGKLEESRARLEEALVLLRAIGDPSNEGRTLCKLGELLALQGDETAGRESMETAVEILRGAGDRDGVARAADRLGDSCLRSGDLVQAKRWHETALALFREVGSPGLGAYAWHRLGKIADEEGDLPTAMNMTDRAMTDYLELGMNDSAAEMCLYLGRLSLRADSLPRAVASLVKALELARNRVGPAALDGLAAAAEEGGRGVVVAELVGAASMARETAGVPADDEDEEFVESVRQTLTTRYGAEAFEQAWSTGRLLSFEEAVVRAAELTATITGASQAAVGAAGGVGFVREGEVWVVTFEDRTLRMQQSLGMQHLATLVASPGREVHALDLVAGPGGAAAAGVRTEDSMTDSRGGDAGDMLDAEARAAYERRLVELEEELEEAETFNDQGKATMLRAELDALIDELKRATGLGGRSRKAASESERARLNVQRTIKAAVKRIAEQDRPLGRHLDAAVKTGTYCSYIP